MFLHVCVILFTGGDLPQCMLGNPPSPGKADPPPARRPPLARRSPPVQCMLGDTVNKRAVCILLEKNKISIRKMTLVSYSDRTYVGIRPGPGPEWVTVYYVKPSHCNLCGKLNMSYTLALYQS